MNFIEHLKLLAHLSLPPKLLVTLKWVGSVALGTAVDTWGVSHTPPPQPLFYVLREECSGLAPDFNSTSSLVVCATVKDREGNSHAKFYKTVHISYYGS